MWWLKKSHLQVSEKIIHIIYAESISILIAVNEEMQCLKTVKFTLVNGIMGLCYCLKKISEK
jgi:hypothetical protein